MTKPLIEKELEKLEKNGAWYKYYTKNRELKEIIKNCQAKAEKRIDKLSDTSELVAKYKVKKIIRNIYG